MEAVRAVAVLLCVGEVSRHEICVNYERFTLSAWNLGHGKAAAKIGGDTSFTPYLHKRLIAAGFEVRS